MAILICWASGLLEVKKNSEEQLDGGPVVLARGTAGRLRSLMVGHGQQSPLDKTQFVVPGVIHLPAEDQHARMTVVLAFAKKINASTKTRKEKIDAES